MGMEQPHDLQPSPDDTEKEKPAGGGLSEKDLEALAWVQGRLDEGKHMAREALVEASKRDPLTGLMLRNAFVQHLEKDVHELNIGGERKDRIKSLALLFIDLDRFKLINDTFGHAAGDEVLARSAELILEHIRERSDIASRWGGEEIVIALRNMTRKEAARKAEELRSAIAQQQFSFDGAPYRPTASIGVAVADAEHGVISHQELIDLADAAMYRAKETRDRVTVAW